MAETLSPDGGDSISSSPQASTPEAGPQASESSSSSARSPTSSDLTTIKLSKSATKAKKRHLMKPYTRPTVNVYTASSSLLTINGRPRSPSHSIPASADEILFHNPKDLRWKIPDEVDMLIRNEEVLDNLPDSDLLKALHAYTADFVKANGWEQVGSRMLDEGALLAMGCVLEEWCKEMVGKQGDLVFAERNNAEGP